MCEIDTSGDDGYAVAIDPPSHEGAIVFGDGNHMLELADGGALVAEHLPEFHAVHHLFCGIARGGGVSAPNFAFHVVLEQHTWDAETSGKVDRSIQEIAHGDIEAPLAEPGLELFLDRSVSKAADCIRRLGPEMSQIIEAARSSRKFALAGANGYRAGQLLLQIALVVRVGRSSIVGIKRKLMPRGQVSQDVVRADIAAVLHREELIGFYPENSHTGSSYVELLMSSSYVDLLSVDQRTQIAFLPVTKLIKATMAAELRTTKVRAGSAMRESGPILTPASAARLSA